MSRSSVVHVALFALAIACSRTEPTSTSKSILHFDSDMPTEESLVAMFASERIPSMARLVPAEGQDPAASQVLAPRSWTWTGEAKKADGAVSPFTTTVTLRAVKIEKSATEPSRYVGIVSWDCTGTGPYRCFENRYLHEQTRYEFEAARREWQTLETRRAP